MNANGQARGAGLTLRQRVLSALVGVGLAALLATAIALSPSERGWGTHRQLGLPPCTFQSLVGVRCPSCGMTTSWAWLVRGNVVRAVQSNVGGTMLAAISMVATPFLLASAIRGRWILSPPGDGLLAGAAIVVVVITLIDWGIRLATG